MILHVDLKQSNSQKQIRTVVAKDQRLGEMMRGGPKCTDFQL